jgi:predicted Zn-dependent peptidase
MKTIQKKLKNGLHILLIDKPFLPTIAVEFSVPTGSYDEKRGKYGVATLAHRMCLRCSVKFPDTYTLNVYTEKMGALLSSVSSKETTSFMISAPLEHFEKIVELLSELIKNPLDKEKDLSNEKIILSHHIKEIYDDPREFALASFSEQIFSKSPYAHSNLGRLEDLPSITAEDLKTFRKNYFTDKSLLTICGDFSKQNGLEKIVNLLNKYFNYKLTENDEQVTQIKDSTSYTQFIHRDIHQPVMIMGTYAPSITNKDFYPFQIVRMILGTGWGGKATQIIREKLHLAYYAYSFYYALKRSGIIGIACGIFEPMALKGKDTMVRLLRDMQEGNFSRKDIQRAKGFYQGILISYNETSEEIAHFFSHQLLATGKLKTLENIQEEIESVTHEKLVFLCKKYFSQKQFFTIVGQKNLKKS